MKRYIILLCAFMWFNFAYAGKVFYVELADETVIPEKISIEVRDSQIKVRSNIPYSLKIKESSNLGAIILDEELQASSTHKFLLNEHLDGNKNVNSDYLIVYNLKSKKELSLIVHGDGGTIIAMRDISSERTSLKAKSFQQYGHYV
jgi:hypothetical protein